MTDVTHDRPELAFLLKNLIGSRALGLAATTSFVTFAAPVRNVVAAQAKLDDPTIVAIFDVAKTGEKKGTTKEVRELAKMFAHDHATVRQQGRDLAKKLHVTPTPPKDFALAKSHAEAMEKLETLNGKAFDKYFLENEVAYHKAVIDAMNTTLLPALQNAEVKALVVKVAPAFKAHQDAAQNLLNKQ
jgi:putative membrane protein